MRSKLSDKHLRRAAVARECSSSSVSPASSRSESSVSEAESACCPAQLHVSFGDSHSSHTRRGSHASSFAAHSVAEWPHGHASKVGALARSGGRPASSRAVAPWSDPPRRSALGESGASSTFMSPSSSSLAAVAARDADGSPPRRSRLPTASTRTPSSKRSSALAMERPQSDAHSCEGGGGEGGGEGGKGLTGLHVAGANGTSQPPGSHHAQ